MLRWLFLFSVTVLCLSGYATLPVELTNLVSLEQQSSGIATGNTTASTCAITQPFQGKPPDDPNADPFGFGNWYVNADRSIWAGLPLDRLWRSDGEKVLWI